MGWRDRDYNQSRRGGGGTYNPLLWLMFGSIPLGTLFGIRLRAHVSLLLYALFELFFAGSLGWSYVLTNITILYAIVFLHEMGHCLGARLVGGYAEEVLLWILGGVAYTHTARRPWPRFVTVAAGPAVNVIICIIAGAILQAYVGWHWALPVNPLLPFVGKYFAEDSSWLYLAPVMWQHPWTEYVWWVYSVSLSILFFNLLPIYPMDGGKLAQIMLWKPLGYYKSMNASCIIGMVVAVPVALFGLAMGSFLLAGLAVMGFINCMNERRQLLAEGPHAFADDEGDYAAAMWSEAEIHRGGKAKKKGWFRAAAKKAASERAERARIDAILEKVHDRGLHSLSWFEKRALKKATERQRQRDLAERNA